jgi:hypothetical protein
VGEHTVTVTMNGILFASTTDSSTTLVVHPMLWIPPGTRFDFFANFGPVFAHAIGFQLEV